MSIVPKSDLKLGVTVNIDNLFRTVSRYFGSADSALTEAVQNAYRSYLPRDLAGPAPVIRIDTSAEGVAVTDYGRGIADPMNMLSIASSDWAAGVEQKHNPAGMGVCGILAFCKSATWISTFGTIRVDSERFFNDSSYRENLGAEVQHNGPFVGTQLMMDGFTGQLTMDKVSKLFGRYLTASIAFNGSPIQIAQLPPRVAIHPTGNSTIHSLLGDDLPDYGAAPQIRVFWHGHDIGVPDFSPAAITLESPGGPLTYTSAYGGLRVFVNVLDENVITPKLPDRTSLIQDERTTTFLAEAWRAAVEAYHEKLCHRIESEPSSITELKKWRERPIGVAGWLEAFATNPYKIVKTCRLRADSRWRDDMGFKNAAVVANSNKVHLYTKDNTVLLVGDTIKDGLCSSGGTGLLFDDGSVDPLEALGFYDAYAATHVLLVDAGAATKLPDRAEKPLIHCVPEFYMVEVNKWRELTNGLLLYTAATVRDMFASSKLDIEDVYTVIMCETDIDSSRLTESFVYLSEGNISDAEDVFDKMFNSWVAHEYSNDSEGQADVYSDYNSVWRKANAAWEGKLALAGNVHSIAASLPGRPLRFTIDLTTNTVEVEGTIYPAVFQ